MAELPPRRIDDGGEWYIHRVPELCFLVIEQAQGSQTSILERLSKRSLVRYTQTVETFVRNAILHAKAFTLYPDPRIG